MYRWVSAASLWWELAAWFRAPGLAGTGLDKGEMLMSFRKG